MQCDITDSMKADKSCNTMHQTNQTETPLFYFTTDKTCDIIDLINDRSIQHQITAWEKMCKQLDQVQAPPILQKIN